MPSAAAQPARLSLLLVLVLAAASLLSGCGATTVRGRVLDDQKQPIRGAAVSTEPPTDQRISDQLGYFSIERLIDENSVTRPLSPGKYTLTIKKLGYEDKAITIALENRQDLSLGNVVLVRKKIDVTVDDVEASTMRGPVGADMTYSPVRGE